MSAPPEKIRLIPDEFHVHNVGGLPSGDLYWIDIQLSWEADLNATRDFLCIYVFAPDGSLKSHLITDLGLRSEQQQVSAPLIEEWYGNHPGTIERDIWVRPFSVEHMGRTFGLIVSEEEGETLVEAKPGNTLMFYAPWEEGLYDT